MFHKIKLMISCIPNPLLFSKTFLFLNFSEMNMQYIVIYRNMSAKRMVSVLSGGSEISLINGFHQHQSRGHIHHSCLHFTRHQKGDIITESNEVPAYILEGNAFVLFKALLTMKFD